MPLLTKKTILDQGYGRGGGSLLGPRFSVALGVTLARGTPLFLSGRNQAFAFLAAVLIWRYMNPRSTGLSHAATNK